MDEPNPVLAAWKRVTLNVGLDDTSLEVPEQLPTGDVWRELLAWAEGQRVLGLLWQLANEAGFSGPMLDDLSPRAKAWSFRTLAVEGSIPSVVDLLGEASIDWRVLKGVATSRLFYGGFGVRIFGDIDILVRPADLDRTLRALAPITAVGASPLHGPFRSRALQERQVTDFRGVELDVHKAVEGSLVTSRLPVEAFFERPQELEVSGRTVLTSSTEVLFVHAVMHFSSAGRRFSTVPDIARLIRGIEPDDPTVRSMLLTRSSRLLFHWALRSAGEWTQLPDAWIRFLADNAPNAVDRTAVNWVQQAPSRSSLVNLFLGRHKIRRGIETLWPTEEFLQFMQTGHLGHLRRLVVKSSDLSS